MRCTLVLVLAWELESMVVRAACPSLLNLVLNPNIETLGATTDATPRPEAFVALLAYASQPWRTLACQEKPLPIKNATLAHNPAARVNKDAAANACDLRAQRLPRPRKALTCAASPRTWVSP